MTQAATATETTASGQRNTRSFRIWDGSYDDLKHVAETAGTPPTTLVGDAVEALLCGYIRCNRCGMPVPVKIGDCSGVDLGLAVAGAVSEVYAQGCWAYEGVERRRRPSHKPVLIGREKRGRKP